MRAGAVQLTTTADFDHNLETADRLTRAAARDGARLVVLPEKWTGIGGNDVEQAAAVRAGDARAWAIDLTKELGIDLIGSWAHDGDERRRNTAVHVAPSGIAATYTKMHLFDVEVDGRAYRESDAESAGDEPVKTDVQGTQVGIAICYDLRFPALFEALDAEIFAVPSAFTLATTRDHWDVLVRARAIEQQAFFVAANQVGEHANGARSGGRSMIVDPWGVVLAQAPDKETHLIADLDMDQLTDVRRRLPALEHRRDVKVHA